MRSVYLDYAATTPTDPSVLKAMLPYFSEEYGNPFSLHSPGQRAKAAIEEARYRTASLIGSDADEILFTSGGTESDNLAVKATALALKDRGNHIITSRVEHHAVLESCRFLENNGFEVSYIPVDSYGRVDPDDIRDAVTDKTVLISVMHANNEVGTIQPIAEIGSVAADRGVVFHTDAVQSYGHLPLKVDENHIDALSSSAHKLYGPKGVGFLYLRKGTRMRPLFHGGYHERGLRPSTHNVPGIVGMGEASVIALNCMEEEKTRLTGLRNRLFEGMNREIDGVTLNGHPEERLPGNLNVSFENVEGEPLLLSLDIMGISCSSGSACDSLSVEPSHVLRAIGLSRKRAYGSIRLSLGRLTTESDVDYVLEVLPDAVRRIRSLGGSQ